MIYSELISLCLVAVIWGSTNAFINKASKKILKLNTTNNKNISKSNFLEFITVPSYFIPVSFNLLGSLVYFYKLEKSSNSKYLIMNLPLLELSISGPLTNSLTLVFTSIFGFFCNGDRLSLKIIVGVIFVIMGTTLAII